MESYTQRTKLWSSDYKLRFEKWFVRYCSRRYNEKSKEFEVVSGLYNEELSRQLGNWDDTLRRSLLKKMLREENAHLFMSLRGYVLDCSCGRRYDVRNVEEDEMVEQGDVEQPSVSQSANIKFVDERETSASSAYVTGSTSGMDNTGSVAENEWRLREILTREYPVRTVAWSTADARDKDLMREGIPNILIKSTNAMNVQQLKMFAFLRAGMRLRFQLNGNKFVCGRLIAYFVPLSWKDDDDQTNYSINNRVCWPHVILDASVSNSAILDIPFVNPLSYFSQNMGTLENPSLNALGQIVLQPLNMLKAAPGASQVVYITVYASLLNPSVHQTTEPVTFDYGDGILVPSLLPNMEEQGAVASGLGHVIDGGVRGLFNYTGGLAAGALKGVLGLTDKPINPLSPEPIINKTCDALAHGVGLDRSVRLGLLPSCETETDLEQIGANIQDFDMKKLCQIPSILKTLTWSDGDITGTTLFEAAVMPTFIDKDNYSTNDSLQYAQYSPSMLAYISRGFCLWRGSIEYRIQVVKTPQHAGRLLLEFDPHAVNGLPAGDFKKILNHNLVVMDIEEKQELTIRVPYMSPRPWLRCDHLRTTDNLNATGKPGPEYTAGLPMKLAGEMNGVFRVHVLNNLVRPSSVPSSVEINVYVNAGDDFELAVPGPLTPLDVTRPSGSELNRISYPMCKDGAIDFCADTNNIWDLWLNGYRLYQKRHITASTNDGEWYSYTVRNSVVSIEANIWQYRVAIIKLVLQNSPDSACAKLIKNLPKYKPNKNLDMDEQAKFIADARTHFKKSNSQLDNTIRLVNADIAQGKQIVNELKVANKGINIINDDTRNLSGISNKIDRVETGVQLINNSTKDNGILQSNVSKISSIVESNGDKIDQMQKLNNVFQPEVRLKVSTITDNTNRILRLVDKQQNDEDEMVEQCSVTPLFSADYEQYCKWVENRVVQLHLDVYRVYSYSDHADDNVLKTLRRGMQAYILRPTPKNKRKALNAVEQASRYFRNDADVGWMMPMQWCRDEDAALHELYSITDIESYAHIRWNKVWMLSKAYALMQYLDAPMMEQADSAESFVTTREDSGDVVPITKAINEVEPAPVTVSENAMNIQTVIRRYYPMLVTQQITNTADFTLISIPVNPSFLPRSIDKYQGGSNVGSLQLREQNCNWLSWITRLYTYWRGTLRYKIIVNGTSRDVYTWHDPYDTSTFSIIGGITPQSVYSQMNFASVAMSTNTQNAIEVAVPFYSPYNSCVVDAHHGNYDLLSQNGTLFIAVRNTDEPLNLGVFVAAGEDFFLHLLRAPPIIYEPKQLVYSNADLKLTTEYKPYPDSQVSMGNTGHRQMLPFRNKFIGVKGILGTCFNIAESESVKDTEQDFHKCQLTDNDEPMCEQGVFGIPDVDSFVQTKVDYGIEAFMNTPEVAQVTNTFKNMDRVMEDIKYKVIPDMTRSSAKFNDAVDEWKSKFPGAMHGVESASHNVGAAADVLTKVFEGQHAILNAMRISGRIFISGNALFSIIDLLRDFSFQKLMDTAMRVALALAIEIETVVAVIKMVGDYFSSEAGRAEVGNGAREQSIQDFCINNKNHIVASLATICTMLYAAIFGKMPSMRNIINNIKKWFENEDMSEQADIASWMRDIHFSTMGFKAISTVYNKFESFVHWIIDKWCKTEAPSVIAAKHLEEKQEEILSWLREIETLSDDALLHEALSDPMYHNRFYTLIEQSEVYTRWALNTPGLSPVLVGIIREGRTAAKNLIDKLSEIRPAHGFRYCPFVVFIHGKSGVGKSRVMSRIRNVIKTNLNAAQYNLVYSMPAKDQYLSGYEQQSIVEWDDMLQNSEQDEIVPEFINWVSNADTRVNMAHVDKKGRLFTSKAIIATTNCPYTVPTNIRHKEAFYNRRHLMIEVAFKQGFNAEMMQVAEEDENFSHANFYITHRATERRISGPHSLVGVLEILREKHLTWHDKQLKAVRDYFLQNGSMQIPKGVQVECYQEEREEVVEDVDQRSDSDSSEAGLSTFDFTLEDFLSNSTYSLDIEEEHIEDDLEREFNEMQIGSFREQFHNASDRQKHLWWIWCKFRSAMKVVQTSIKRLLHKCKELFGRAATSVMDRAKAFYENHPKLVMVFGFLTMSATVLAIAQMFKSSNDDGNDAVVTEGAPYNHKVPKVKARVVVESAEGMSCQGTTDPSATVVAAKMWDSMAVVGWLTKGPVLRAIYVGGRLLFLPHHFFRQAIKGNSFYILRGSHKIAVEYNPDNMERLGDKDACLYYVGPNIQAQPHLFKFFVESEGLANRSEMDIILAGITADGKNTMKCARAEADRKMKYGGEGSTEETKYVQTGWKYDMHTEPGECGSIIVACSKSLKPPQRIVGLHTAGYADRIGGFGPVITKEMIVKAAESIVQRCGFAAMAGLKVPDQVQVGNEQCCILPEGDFSFVGKMDKGWCPSQPQSTYLKKTPFYNEIAVSAKAPAMLRANESVSPLRKGIEKFGKNSLDFPQDMVDHVTQSLSDELLALVSDVPVAPLSNEHAVFGIDGVEYCDSINMQSSAGWPYQVEIRKAGKAHYFCNNEIMEPVLSRIKQREEKAKNLERVPSIWRDCLKDELRPLEKVRSGSTRVFTIAPVDFTIVCRKYTMAFVHAFYKSNAKFFSAVGMNPESMDWTVMRSYLEECGADCIAGDYSCYDGTLKAQLIWSVFEIIDSWYKRKGSWSEEDRNVRAVIFDEIIHTMQLVMDCVYMTHRGNPSGNPLTVVINTIINEMHVRLVWLMRAPPLYRNMLMFKRCVRTKSYGDDIVLTVKREVQDFMNQEIMTNELDKYGIVFTNENKDGTVYNIRSLDEVSFLKRGFRKDDNFPGLCLPNITLDTIYELFNWYHSTENVHEQLRMNMRCAMAFAFFHGEEFYNSLYDKAVEVYIAHGIEPHFFSFYEWVGIFSQIVSGDASMEVVKEFRSYFE